MPLKTEMTMEKQPFEDVPYVPPIENTQMLNVWPILPTFG